MIQIRINSRIVKKSIKRKKEVTFLKYHSLNNETQKKGTKKKTKRSSQDRN